LIVGIGVDLVDVSRMERTLRSRWAERFLARVFSAEEIAVCEAGASPAQAYAARFAAKEAVVKALGTGFSRGVRPGQIIVQGGERSQPTVKLLANAHARAQSLHVGRIHLSLSHTPHTAAATVVLETREDQTAQTT